MQNFFTAVRCLIHGIVCTLRDVCLTIVVALFMNHFCDLAGKGFLIGLDKSSRMKGFKLFLLDSMYV